MAIYKFPAVFSQDQKGKHTVYFPDLHGCRAAGRDLDDAIEIAEDELSLRLFKMERDGTDIPSPSEEKLVPHASNAFVKMVSVDTSLYRAS